MSEFKEEVRDVDVLVIGAGPSGTVAASILKNSGLDVYGGKASVSMICYWRELAAPVHGKFGPCGFVGNHQGRRFSTEIWS